MAKHTQEHAVNWFEIPVSDLARAKTFYETILAKPLRQEVMGDSTLAVFPCDESGVGGCLLAGNGAPQPSGAGTLVYLNAQPSLDAVLARVQAAGGRIATPRIELPGDMGCFAHVVDTEGNRVGLHSLA